MHHSSSHCYLNRPAETLVLQGYRQWSMGVVTQSTHHWDEAWNLFCKTLGAEKARPCMDAMIMFMKTLGLCASCFLRTLAPDCNGMCKDECLILGLVSALQNGDADSADYCLTRLTCPTRCHDVAFAAGEFAMALRGAGCTLVPIPKNVLSDIVYGAAQPQSKTLH